MEHHLPQLYELESDIDQKLDRLERMVNQIDDKIFKLEIQLIWGFAFVVILIAALIH